MHLQKGGFEFVTREFKSLLQNLNSMPRGIRIHNSKIIISQLDLQPLVSFYKWDSNSFFEDSNSSCVLHISRFLNSNHCKWDSNQTFFLFHLYLKDLQMESNPSCEDSNPWPLSHFLLHLRFESI